jgi:hypothetical protein
MSVTGNRSNGTRHHSPGSDNDALWKHTQTITGRLAQLKGDPSANRQDHRTNIAGKQVNGVMSIKRSLWVCAF